MANQKMRGLGTPRKFGVEIEFLGMNSNAAADALSAAVPEETFVSYSYDDHCGAPYDHWHVTTDGSLPDYDNCAELVSRVMRTDALEDWAALKKVCDALNDHGGEVSKQTGFHVHVDVSDLKQSEVIRIMKAYREYEGIIDLVVSPSRRKDFNTYCGSLRNIPPRMFQKRSVSGLNDSALDGEKYWKVNTLCYGELKTIEFRQHHGTINFHKIQSWIKFCVEFVNLARSTMPIGTLKDYNTLERRSKSLVEEVLSLKSASTDVKTFFMMLGFGGILVGEDTPIVRDTAYYAGYCIFNNFGMSNIFGDLHGMRAQSVPGTHYVQAYFSVFDFATANDPRMMRTRIECAVNAIGDPLEKVYRKVFMSSRNSDIIDIRGDWKKSLVDWAVQMCSIHFANGTDHTEKSVRWFLKDEHEDFWSKFSSNVKDYYLRRTKVYRELMS